MSSAICFNMDQSIILSSGNGLNVHHVHSMSNSTNILLISSIDYLKKKKLSWISLASLFTIQSAKKKNLKEKTLSKEQKMQELGSVYSTILRYSQTKANA